MSSIVNQSLSSYSKIASVSSTYNPFVPPQDLILPSAPSVDRKVQVTSSSSQGFDKTLKFQLNSGSLIRGVYAIVTLTWAASASLPPAPCLQAIRSFQVRASNGNDLTPITDMASVYSYYRSMSNENWFGSVAEIAGGYSTTASTVTGVVEIPVPWSSFVTGNPDAVLPLMKLGGSKSIDIYINTESASLLQNGDSANPTDIDVSLYYYTSEIPSDLYQSLDAMPEYKIYTREFQSLLDVSLTTSDVTESGRFASGRLLSYFVTNHLDSETNNKYILEPLTNFKLQMGSEVIYETFSGSKEELYQNVLSLGAYNKYGNSAFVLPSTGSKDLGSISIYTFNGSSDSIKSLGPKVEDFNSIVLTLKSASASCTAAITAEVLVCLKISGNSIERVYV